MAGVLDGQLWFIAQGGPSDADTGHVNSDGSNVTQAGTQLSGDQSQTVGIDLAAGLYFTINSGTLTLQTRSISNPSVVLSSVQIGNDLNTPSQADDDVVNALAVDPYTHTIYVGLWGQDKAHTGIVEVSYNTSTGVLDPNAAYGSAGVYDANTPYLISNQANFTDARDFAIDHNGGFLYYTDDDNQYSFSPFSPTNGIYRVSLSGGAPVEITSNANTTGGFPTNQSLGIIGPMALDKTKGLIYFETNHAGNSTGTLWYVSSSATGALATQVTLPGGSAIGFGDVPQGGISIDEQNQYIFITVQSGSAFAGPDEILQGVLSADGHTITSWINTYSIATLDGHTPNANSHIADTAFDQLPTLTITGTGTHAPEQGANPAGFIDLTSSATTITDTDGNHLASATVQITGGTFTANETSANDDHLTVNDSGTFKSTGTFTGTSIAISYDSASETLTLTGYDTLTNYQTVLNAVTFNTTGDNPTDYGLNNTRTIHWTASDGAQNVPFGAQNSQSTTLTIDAQNDAPNVNVGGGDSASIAVNETNAGLNQSRSLTIADPDSLTETLTLTNASFSAVGPTNGITNATLEGFFSIPASVNITQATGSASFNWTFNSGSEAFNYLPAGTTLTLNYSIHDVDSNNSNGPGSAALSDDQAISVVITGTNDAPVVTAGNTLGYTENQAATAISPAATITDVDSADFNTGSLTIGFTANGTAADQLTIKTDATVTVAAGTVSVSGNAVGTVSGGTNGSNLVISFNSANATPAAITTLLEHIAYSNNSDNPSTLARTVTYTLNDGDGTANGGSNIGTATATINVTAVNDPPVDSVPGAQVVNEDATLVFNAAHSNLISISDPDVQAGNETVTLTVTHGIVTLGTTNNIVVDSGANNSSTVTFHGTLANVNTALNGLSYTPASNFNGSASLSITTNDNGNTGVDPGTSGGPTNEQDQDNIAITVSPVNDAPTVVNGTSVSLVATDEDTPSASISINSLLSTHFSDALDDQLANGGSAPNNFAGIAVIQNSASAGQGTWEYSTNGGTNWTPFPGSITSTTALLIAATDLIRFEPAANFNGTPGGLTVNLIDDSAGAITTGGQADLTTTGGTTRYSSTSITIGETVNAVNDAPTFTNLDGTPLFTEGGAAVVLDNNAVAHDVELDALNGGNGNYNLATLTLARHGGASTQDVFGTSGTLTLAAGNVNIGATTVGTFTNSGGTLAITFNSSATTTLVGNVLDQITYANNSDAPPASVQIDYTLNDGNSGSQGSGGALSATGHVTVTITPTNDAPDVTPNSPSAVAYQLTQASPIGLLSTGAVTDPDQPANFNGGDLTVAITANAQAGDAIVLLASSGFSVTGAGPFTLNDGATAIGTVTGLDTPSTSVTVTFNSNATPTEVDKLLEAFGFTATGTAGTDRSVTFTFHDGGNVGDVAPGAVDATPPVQIVHVNTAPVATDPTISVTGNATDPVEQTGRITLATAVSITTNATQDPTDTIHTATVTISGSFPGSGDELSVLDAGGTTHVTSGALADFPHISVSVTTDANGNETLTLTGTNVGGVDARANFQAALAKVQFLPNSDNPTDFNLHTSRTLTWSVNDGTTSSLAVQTNTTIDPVNDAPTNTVPGTTQTVNEDTALAFTGGNTISVSDPDNQSLSVTVSATHGGVTLGSTTNVTVSGNGSHNVTLSGLSADVNNALATLSYKGDANFNGSDTLVVSTNDGIAAATVSNVSITVSPVDDAPSGSDNSVSTALNIAHTFTSGEFGFSDAVDQIGGGGSSANNFFAVKITTLSLAAGATLKNGAATVNAGDTVLVSDISLNKLVFTPATGAGGANYSHFTFQVVDDGSNVAPNANIDPTPNLMTINVGSGFGPTAAADAYPVLEGAQVTGTDGTGGTGVLHNDSGSSLTVTAVNGSGGNVNNSTAGTYGHLTMDAQGGFTYAADNTAAIDGVGSATHPVDTFNYTVTDGASLSATTTVSFSIDRPPTIATHTVDVVRNATVGPASANDTDPDGDSLTVTAVTGGAVGSPHAGTFGSVTINSNDTYSYSASNTANIDAFATGSHPVDTFTYTVDDGLGGTANETLNFSVDRAPGAVTDNDPANDSGPAKGAITEGAAAGTTVGITASATDPDGDTLSYSLTTNPGGFFTVDSNTGVVSVDTNGATGIDFETAPGHAYSITVQATDGHGAISSQSFSIAVNDAAPSAPADSDTGTADAVAEAAAANTYTGLTASSIDPNGGTIVYSLTDTAGGAFKINSSNGQVSVNDPTAINYESAPGHALTVTVQAATTGGTLVSTHDFSIAITNANPSTPTDSDVNANSVTEGDPADTLVHVTASSTDPNGPPVAYSIITDPSNGGFKIDSATGVVSVNDATRINYETAPGHAYSITVQASDGAGGTSTQSFSIAVGDVGPVAADDTFDGATSVDEDQTLTVLAADGVLANDTDVNGGPLTAVLNLGPTHAASFTFNADGSFSYTPSANFNGTDSFTYHAFDGAQSSGVVTATITINPVNDAPVFANLGGASHPAFVENGSSIVLDNNVTVSDLELDALGNYGGASLTLQRHLGANPDDSFAGTGGLDLADSNGLGENVSLDGGGTFIGTATQPGDGSFSIVFNASATAADVASVMQQIVYANASDNPPASAQIDWIFNDGNTGSQGSGGAGVGLGSVTVDITQVDDAPVLTNVAPTAAYSIGSPGVVLSPALGVFDADATPPSPLTGIANATVKIASGFLAGDQLFVNLSTSGGFFIVDDGSGPVVTNISVTSNAAGTMVLGGTDTTQHYQDVLDAVNYRSTAADPSNGGADPTRNISWQVNDGALNSQTPDPDPNNLVNETVVHFATPPAVDLDASGAGTGFTTTYTENQAPIPITDTDLSITDPDDANLDQATIVLTNAKAGDVLSIAGALPAGIASAIDTSVAGKITLLLTGSATLADYQTAVGQVRFSSTSELPDTTDRDITVEVSNVDDSNTAHATVHVVSVNDAPVNTLPVSPLSAAATGSVVITGLSVADLDAANGSETTILSVQHGTLNVAAAGGASVIGSGTGTVTVTGTLSAINATLLASGNVAYHATSGFMGVDTLTMSTNDNGNTGGAPLTDTDLLFINNFDDARGAPPPLPHGAFTYHSPVDLNGDGMGDILFRQTAGTIDAWLLNGPVKQVDQVVSALGNDWHVAAKDDFNGDGKTDILLRHDNGTVALWTMNGAQKAADQIVSALGNDWHIAATDDFNGDGKSDILLRHDNGTIALWTMNGATKTADQIVSALGNDWHIAATDDFNGDGKSDILLRHDNGTIALWTMNGATKVADQIVSALGNDWHIATTADFNGDGKTDILLRHDNGTVALWTMNGAQKVADQVIGPMDNSWHLLGAGDFNADGHADLLWRNDNGAVEVWEMNGAQKVVEQVVSPMGNDWHFAGLTDVNNDHMTDILWRHDNGDVAVWEMNGAHKVVDQVISHIGNDWVIV